MQALGVVDVAANNVNENEVLAHALANVSGADKETAFAVKRGGTFVNEYPRRNADGSLSEGSVDNPNHLLGSFPCLFPYGQGGFEVPRPTKVTYETHSRWALRYADRRFCKDFHFIFLVFGVLQKRQLCAAAVLQISKPIFTRYEHELRHLHPSDFEIAATEEQARKPFSNPTMKALRRDLTTIRAKVMGTDESRIKIRSLIWGMCVKKGPPSIWLTINPADTQDPIAQVFCGHDLDLDNFNALEHDLCDSSVRSDPYTSASFFHFMINALLVSLLGIKVSVHKKIERKTGILGIVEGYIGTVEAQGRGTLHLHMLLWLKGSPSSQQMKEKLSHENFRERVRDFISANIRADLDGAPGTSVLAIPHVKRVAFSRPLDPCQPNYEQQRREKERALARIVQVHQCGNGCLKFNKGRAICKRKAPFQLSDRDWVDEEGNWGPKRTYGYFNNWNPEILQSFRSNHDIKFLSNGTGTKKIAWYITHYVAKKQHASSNTSALLAKTLAFHQADEKRTKKSAAMNKKLIQRCANTLTREQEVSAPEVTSYLMGKGDRYVSHHFETVQIFPILKMLKATFPELNGNRCGLFVCNQKLAIDILNNVVSDAVSETTQTAAQNSRTTDYVCHNRFYLCDEKLKCRRTRTPYA